MALVDIVADADLEQLVWDDIQNDGLDAVCQRRTDIETGSNKIAPANPFAACSPSVSSMSEHDTSTVVTGALARATDDAGSGSATAAAFSSAEGTVPPQISTGDVASSAQLADMGPFASLEHCSLALGPAPSVGMALHRTGSLNLNPSMVTYRTRALAAAAGSVRNGAVGSNLRLAAVMLRSNSGGLAETLISEQARAESGLLTASLGRCDSLPELCLAPSGTDLVDIMALRDMDAFSGMPSCAGLPSLSMLFGERPDFGAIAGTAADPQHQQRMGACPASAAPESALQAATGTDGMWEETGALPGWISGSRFLGRPPSFSANGAAALFAGGSSAQPPQSPVHGLPLQTSGPSGGRHEPLKPPSLVDYSQMLMQKDPAPAAAGFAAPGHACAPAQPEVGPAAVASALGFEAFSLPSFGRMQPLLMDRQDTFELLMRQVEQEITAEAEVKQYAALEMGTIEVPARSHAAAPAGAVPPFIDEAAAAAAVPAVLRAAAESAAAAPAPAPKRRSVFELMRPSVFEGHTALGPAGLSAVSAGGPPAPVLDTLGPSFANWVPPSDPSNTSQVSATTVAAGTAGASADGAPASTGTAAVPSSPFCLPISTPLLAGGDSSAASAPADSGATELVKQDVARYSRVITCKTYLKRLNITQPMAEHLLPPHDLSLPAKPRSSADGADDDDEPSGKKGTYEQLFKEQVVLIDEAGAPFRVQYEGVACNAQKHLRLTCGWRDYIRQHKVEVGDTVLFERRGDERHVIYITLVKASDAPVELGPETKKRRIGRKQAVQRLE